MSKSIDVVKVRQLTSELTTLVRENDVLVRKIYELEKDILDQELVVDEEDITNSKRQKDIYKTITNEVYENGTMQVARKYNVSPAIVTSMKNGKQRNTKPFENYTEPDKNLPEYKGETTVKAVCEELKRLGYRNKNVGITSNVFTRACSGVRIASTSLSGLLNKLKEHYYLPYDVVDEITKSNASNLKGKPITPKELIKRLLSVKTGVNDIDTTCKFAAGTASRVRRGVQYTLSNRNYRTLISECKNNGLLSKEEIERLVEYV